MCVWLDISISAQIKGTFVVHQADHHPFDKATPPQNIARQVWSFGKANQCIELKAPHRKMDLMHIGHESTGNCPNGQAQAAAEPG